MSMFNGTALALLIAVSAPAFAIESPHLGQLTSARDVAAWDISVGPEGVGLPAGRGTAKEGEVIYSERCIACHGVNGEGKPNDRLVGGTGTLTGLQPAVKTVGSYWPYATTLFDYVRRAMPLNEPQTLTANEVYALSAHILALNGIIGPNDVMDAKTLPKVKMPNHDNFFIVYPGKLE